MMEEDDSGAEEAEDSSSSSNAAVLGALTKEKDDAVDQLVTAKMQLAHAAMEIEEVKSALRAQEEMMAATAAAAAKQQQQKAVSMWGRRK